MRTIDEVFYLYMNSVDGLSMKEKRKVERFDLHIETTLRVKDEKMEESHPMMLTRDISCTGVFLITDKPLPIGTSVDLDFLLNHHEPDESPKGKGVNIRTNGKVVRRDGQGMAIEFNNQYKVSQLEI